MNETTHIPILRNNDAVRFNEKADQAIIKMKSVNFSKQNETRDSIIDKAKL